MSDVFLYQPVLRGPGQLTKGVSRDYKLLDIPRELVQASSSLKDLVMISLRLLSTSAPHVVKSSL